MKDAIIKLISTQSDGEDNESTELITRGKYGREKDGYVIVYDETEATGYAGATTKIKAFDGGKKIAMERSGAAQSSLIAELGTKHHCQYGTPFGDFMVGVNTKTIKQELDEHGGQLDFSYVIDINSSFVGDFRIFVNVTPSAHQERK